MSRFMLLMAMIVSLLCPAALSEEAAVDSIASVEDATAFAMSFFSLTCLENTDSLTITPVQTDDIWVVYGENETDGVLHLLKFDRNMRINLYQNLTWDTPDMVPTEQLPDFDYSTESSKALEELLQEVRGWGVSTFTAVAKVEEENIWALNLDAFEADGENMMEAYALVRVTEGGPWHLLAYGDMNTNGAFYGAYLARGDAVAIGRQVASEVQGMEADQITVRYARFLYQREVGEDGMSISAPTYWEVTLEADGLAEDPYNEFVDPVFEDDGNGDDKTGWVEVLIDALTGEVLRVLQGSELGNG